MYQGQQVCHWLTDHTRPLFGEREMYVTVQSSLLIILRLPGVCWLEDPRGPPGGAAEQRAPWPGVQRDGTSSTSLTSFPLHGGVGSEQNLQALPEIHVHSNNSVDNASGAVSQGTQVLQALRVGRPQAGEFRWSFEQDHLHQGLHKQIPQSPLRQSRGEGSSGGLDSGTR